MHIEKISDTAVKITETKEDVSIVELSQLIQQKSDLEENLVKTIKAYRKLDLKSFIQI